MPKLSIILYLIQFICPFVLGFEVKVNNVDVGKKERAEKLCEFFFIAHRIQQKFIKLNFLKSKADCSNNYEMIRSFGIGFLGYGEQNIFIQYIFCLTIICFLQYPCLQLLRKNQHNIIIA